MNKYDRHLTVQAQRRLLDCLHGPEWRDLAADIADALEAARATGWPDGETERSIIFAALTDTGET